MSKLIQFGAGKIGRSFIAQLFSRGGYDVVFVDVFKQVIDALNEKREYKVVIKRNEGDELMIIKNVCGVLASDKNKVVDEIVSSDIIAVSVGQHGLPSIMPLIAEALTIRFKNNPQQALDIIIAENLRNASEYFRNELYKHLPTNYPLDSLVGLVETSIGKMVPIMRKKDLEEDTLQVFAEAYNSLVLDKKAFRNTIPTIDGLAPKENMKAWVDRKLFIHNLGHAATAYLGYLKNPKHIFIWEVLADKNLRNDVRDTMLQSGQILMKLYPGEFTQHHIEEHTDDLLNRFENKALGDTVFRVGCDLPRKLSAEDRLAGAARAGISLGLPVNLIVQSYVAGLKFRAHDEEGKMHPADVIFAKSLENALFETLAHTCGLDVQKDSLFINMVMSC